MNGAVTMDGRLDKEGKPMTVDKLEFKVISMGDNQETVFEGSINNVRKAQKEGLSKEEAIKEGMGEKDIVDKGLEDNEKLKEAAKNNGKTKENKDDDGSGMPPPEEENP